MSTTRQRVVIIGGGFGGLTAARYLRHADVILIDRTNHHLFQPLLYQVAAAALPEGDIAWPLRTLFRSRPNIRVVMDEVLSIDRAAKLVIQIHLLLGHRLFQPEVIELGKYPSDLDRLGQRVGNRGV